MELNCDYIYTNINNIKNEKIELYQEDGKYYLRLDFDYEDDNGFYKVHIERIRFDFNLRSINQEINSYNASVMKEVFIDLGLEKLLVEKNPKDHSFFTMTKIKDKVHEFTIEEIERKLGYKVKIVSEHHR